MLLSKIMKPIVIIVYIIFIAIAIHSCKKNTDSKVTMPKPVADFIFSIQNNGIAPVKVTFTATSQNANTYQWFFGDGNTSTASNTENSYLTPGTFSVKLIVSNEYGKDSITKQINITINKPQANFTFSILNDGILPAAVTFTNTSLNGDSYQWYFGDGNSSITNNAQNSYTINKSYIVKLIATNAGGKDSITKEVIINPLNNSVLLYLITPKDKMFNQQYYTAAKSCAINLQNWYKGQMGNKTFVLNPLVIDTLQGLHDASWYNNNNGSVSGSDPRFYGFYNTYNEIQQLLGSKFNTIKYVYLVYVAAPFDGAGSTGFSTMGEGDLKGLLGQNLENLNPNRWIGGAGHELGHGFGLPHPNNQNPQALMWTGYLIYPNCILQQEDRNMLSVSNFFK